MLVSLLALALTILGPVGEPLVEWSRRALPRALEPPVDHGLALAPGGEVAYVSSTGVLYAVSTRDGRLLAEVPVGTDLRSVLVAGTGVDARAVLWSQGTGDLHVVSLADPLHPAFERTLALPRIPYDVLAVPGSARVVVRDESALRVVQLNSDAVPLTLAADAGDYWFNIAMAGTAEAPVVVASGGGAFPGGFSGALAAWDLGTPAPELRFRVPENHVGDGMDGDPDRVVVCDTSQCALHDLATGALHAVVSGLFVRPRLIGDTLMLRFYGGVTLWSLADPHAPLEVGTHVAPGFEPPEVVGGSWPWILVSSEDAGRVDVLDSRTADVAAHLDLGGPRPWRMVSSGTTVVVLSRRLINGDVYTPGGGMEVDVLDVLSPLLPRIAGRWARVAPFRYQEMQLLQLGRARYLALGDAELNSILLTGPQGTVVQTLGLEHGMGVGPMPGKRMAAAGPFLAVAGNGHYAVFRVSRHRLVPVAEPALEPGEEVLGIAVRLDGLVAVSTSRAVVIRARDGTETRLPRGREVPFADITLVSGGSRALDVVRWLPGGITIFDLDNPSGPVVLWNGWHDALHALPMADGTRLLVATGFPARVHLVHLGTGTAAGEPSEELPTQIGPEIALALGSRAVVLAMDPDGEHTLLFDVTGTTPVLLSMSDAWPSRPICLPRPSGAGWVEFRSPFYSGGHDGTVRLLDPDGTLVGTSAPLPWPAGWHGAVGFGRGVYAAAEWRPGNVDLVIWAEH